MKWLGQGAGVTAAELNLKFVWDVVSQVKTGEKGYAYVVDSSWHSHRPPDISLVLQKTDLSKLPQVQAAISGFAKSGRRGVGGRDRSGSTRGIRAYGLFLYWSLGWSVFGGTARQ